MRLGGQRNHAHAQQGQQKLVVAVLLHRPCKINRASFEECQFAGGNCRADSTRNSRKHSWDQAEMEMPAGSGDSCPRAVTRSTRSITPLRTSRASSKLLTVGQTWRGIR